MICCTNEVDFFVNFHMIYLLFLLTETTEDDQYTWCRPFGWNSTCCIIPKGVHALYESEQHGEKSCVPALVLS